MITGTSGLADEEQGLATGLTYTAQQVGLTVGTPVVSTVAATRIGDGSVASARQTLEGVHLGLIVDAAVVAVAAVIAVVFLRQRAKAPSADGSQQAAPAEGSQKVAVHGEATP